MSVFPPIPVETRGLDVSYFDATPRSGELICYCLNTVDELSRHSPFHGIAFGLDGWG